MSGPYDDIIKLPRPVSPTHPRMSVANRAAQFAPFAALTGFEAAIKETGRITSDQVELDEDTLSILDRKLRILAREVTERPLVTVTYFSQDEKKAGGSYATVSKELIKIDGYQHTLVLEDGTSVPIQDIVELESDLFELFL